MGLEDILGWRNLVVVTFGTLDMVPPQKLEAPDFSREKKMGELWQQLIAGLFGSFGEGNDEITTIK